MYIPYFFKISPKFILFQFVICFVPIFAIWIALYDNCCTLVWCEIALFAIKPHLQTTAKIHSIKAAETKSSLQSKHPSLREHKITSQTQSQNSSIGNTSVPSPSFSESEKSPPFTWRKIPLSSFPVWTTTFNSFTWIISFCFPSSFAWPWSLPQRLLSVSDCWEQPGGACFVILEKEV